MVASDLKGVENDNQTCKHKRLSSYLYPLSKEKWISFTEEKVRSLFSTNLSHYLVVEENQKILGFARYLTDEVMTTFLAEIIIDKSHRRKRLGQQLIEEIHKKYPLTRIELISEADGFYRSISFKPVGTGFRKSEWKETANDAWQQTGSDRFAWTS